MSKFRQWLSDPQVHLLVSGLAQAIAIFYPPAAPFIPLLASVAGTLTVTAWALPENGSLHKEDYVALAQRLSEALRPPVETTAGRS